jgi:hypothetical protein
MMAFGVAEAQQHRIIYLASTTSRSPHPPPKPPCTRTYLFSTLNHRQANTFLLALHRIFASFQFIILSLFFPGVFSLFHHRILNIAVRPHALNIILHLKLLWLQIWLLLLHRLPPMHGVESLLLRPQNPGSLPKSSLSSIRSRPLPRTQTYLCGCNGFL